MLAFTNAYLLDGTGKTPVEEATVFVEGSTISKVGKKMPIPDGAQIIDLRGKPLLPGFSDAHAHLGGTHSMERPALIGRFASYDYAENREAFLQWGVTSIRSAGDFTPDIFMFRDDVNTGKIRSPRIITAGRYFQAVGGPPGYTAYAANQTILENATILIDDSTDIEYEVRNHIEAGADLIKAILHGTNTMLDPAESCPRLSNEQIRRIADATHLHGKHLMVHVNDARDFKDAVMNGADSVEHVIQAFTSNHEISDELIEILVNNDIWIVPTMICCKTYDGLFGRPIVYPVLENTVKRFIEAGVKIGVGTDSGVPSIAYGESVHAEMELLTAAGMTPLEAITAATGGNAKLHKMDKAFGTVEPGKTADLVVLGSNPLESIQNTRDIKLVLRDGKIVVDKFLRD